MWFDDIICFLTAGSSLSDDWEKDFDDIDVSEEDLEVAVHQTGNTNEEVDLDDWESWE